MPRCRTSSDGISLLELLCVMACVAIVALLSLPLGMQYRATQQLSLAVSALRHLLLNAQAQAMAQGKRVSVCGSRDGWHCDGGWSYYTLLRGSDGRVRRSLALASGVTLTYHANFGRNHLVEYLGNGMTHGQDGRFDFCTHAAWLPRRCQSLILHFSGQTVG